MKNNFLFFTIALFLIFSYSDSFAQIRTPAPSPTGEFTQTVGLTDITVNYSRPGVKGRKVFVDVESYGNIWRTGANGATTIEFSTDVKLEGKDVPAGKYALYSIPGEEEWTIMLYKDLSLGGNVAGYDESNELLRVNVNAAKNANHIETFTILLGDITSNSANLMLLWADIMVPVKITMDTDAMVMKQIDAFAANPEASLIGQYGAAANYYLNNDKDMDKALVWIDKVVAANPNAFWNIQTKARIYAKKKDYKNAIATAKQSLAVAEQADSDFGYIKSNKDLIAAWEKEL